MAPRQASSLSMLALETAWKSIQFIVYSIGSKSIAGRNINRFVDYNARKVECKAIYIPN
jgi:hypothetical protein